MASMNNSKMATPMAKSTTDVNKKDVTTMFTTATFVVTFIIIGLPLWWKTTNVYRVTLPYAEIEELSSFKILHLIPVTVVLADRNVQQGLLWEELSFLADEYDTVDSSQLSIRYSWNMRTLLEEEEIALQKSQTLSDLDKVLSNVSKVEDAGAIQVLVLEKSDPYRGNTMLVGCHRWGYVSNSIDAKSLGKDIISVVRTMTQADNLQKVFSPPSLNKRKKPDKDRMRSLSATTAFDITFTLIVPEPHVFNVNWDIEDAVNGYIMPFIKKLSTIVDVDIKSQILYMISLPIQTSFHEASREHHLSSEQLPSIINPVEAKLGSYASVNPTLNFVVYIPPQGQSPLRIVDEKDIHVDTNSFLSPQWGGFYVQNILLKSENTSLPYNITLNMQEIMEVFLNQLRSLLGLPDMTDTEGKTVKILHDPKCCKWEVDFLLRKNSQQLLSVAASSLFSLSQLLQTISNIVIRDDVGEKIYFAVSSVKESIYFLQQGFLEKGFREAKNAFTASEEAFFDPSLLALLYFPDDQKYAIYIPLFLPVSIPVIISIRHLWTYWRERKVRKEKIE